MDSGRDLASNKELSVTQQSSLQTKRPNLTLLQEQKDGEDDSARDIMENKVQKKWQKEVEPGVHTKQAANFSNTHTPRLL